MSGGASLDIPDFPPLRKLGSLDGPLRRSGSVEDGRAIAVTGAGAAARLGPSAGGIEVRVPGLHLLTRLHVEASAPVAWSETPAGVERRLRWDGRDLVERVVVPRSGPMCFMEWAAAADGEPLVLSWHIPGWPGGMRWRASGRGMVVAGEVGRILFCFSEAPADLEVRRADGLRVRAVVSPGSGASVGLAVAAVAPGEDEPRVVRSMGRGHAAVSARKAAARRLSDERLAVEAPEPAVGEALEWAKVRLAAAYPSSASGLSVGRGPAPLEARAAHALASLATGDPDPSRRLLTSAPDDLPGDGDRTTWLLLAARHLAWSGDRGTLRNVWDRLSRVAEAWLAERPDEPLDGPGAACARELLVAAEEMADAPLAGRLRARLEDGSAAGPEERTSGGDRSTTDRSTTALDAAAATALVLGWVGDVLGVDPDAPRGRLVLRPRLSAWETLRVRNIPVGSAAVDLGYDRDGAVHRFALRQTRGHAPLQVVFEPVLEDGWAGGGRVTGARVDGQPAELDPVRIEGGWIVPVQLVLDREREVEVEIAAPAG